MSEVAANDTALPELAREEAVPVTQPPFLRIDKLTLQFARAPGAALEDFSLVLGAGETIVLLGENGSGKEALLRLLAGVRERKQRASGEIQFGSAASQSFERAVTITPRTAYLTGPYAAALNPHVPALSQFVRIIGRKRNATVSEARTELSLALQRLPGAPAIDALDTLPGFIAPEALACGLFAASLAQSPQLLLADDPLTQLSPSHARAFADVLLSEQKKLGFAMIYAAQSVESARLLNSNVVVMRAGRIVEEGPMVRLLAAQSQPYTQTLFRVVAASAKEVPSQMQRIHPRGDALLQVRNLKLASQPKQSRDTLNFELRRGASLALIGEQGSGRRALARALLGLDPLTAGRVIFDQVDIGILNERMMSRLRRRVAFITGDDEALDARMTIDDTVAEPLRAHLHLPRDALVRNRDAALKRVGLAALDGSMGVSSLSVFDRRRLQVARAIVSAPLLAVIDEPLRGLDAFAQSVIADLLRSLHDQEGPAFLFITSDFGLARSFCEDALVFKDGQVIERGPISAMLRAPKELHTKKLIDAVAAAPENGLSQAPAPV